MKYSTITSALLLSLISVSSQAGHKNRYYDFAKVTHVEPIVETIEQRTPRENCWNERVRVDDYQQRSHTSMILGGIIGAAIGNELGHHKSNKRVGAVAGSILGASIGKDFSRPQSRDHHYSQRRRCELEHDIEYRQQVVGYDVTYRFRGQEYQMTTDSHPGKKIKMRVHFEPVI